MRHSNIMKKRAQAREEYGDADPAQGTPGGDPVAVSGGVPAEEPVAIPEVVPPSEVNEDTSLELDIQTQVTEDQVARAEAEEVVTAMESLAILHDQIDNLIKTGQCSVATEALIHSQIDMALGKLHMTSSGIAVESLAGETDIVERHRLIMESISMEGETWQRYAQNIVLNFKHHWNATTDFFKTTGGRIGKYRAKLQATRKEYEQKKGNLKGDIPVSQTELWYHFSNDKGPVNSNLMGAMKEDLDMSTFVLTVYPKRVLDAAKKVLSLLQSADLSTPEGALKLGQALERLPTAAEMFDKKFIGPTFFSVKKYEINQGKARHPITVNGKQLTRLAELASHSFVEQTGSVAHTAKKVGAYAAAYAAQVTQPTALAMQVGASAIPGKFTIASQDIGHVLDAGEQYLKNADGYVHLGSEYSQVANSADGAMGNLGAKWASAGKEAGAVLTQAEQYLTNLLLTAFGSPAKAEMARSIKSAKYNMYMANRAIYNGK